MMAVSVWTVSDLTRYVRQVLGKDARLQALAVEGEVSDPRTPASGHLYFTLKDEGAQLRCVMWRNAVLRLSGPPRHGERIIAYGHLSVYEAGGQYQLYCDALVPVGAGDLNARLEALKARLQAEGLFDEARKRPLPPLPRVIGVVTSPDAAAFQDVLNVLRRRYPLARVVLSPTLVQGDEAPLQIVAALAALNARDDIDVILLVRGGGSLEDLWAFNDERVVRAVAASRVPVVAGVGHEVDSTLADFAADVRAPTPSAAAELAAPTVEDLHLRVRQMGEALRSLVGAELAGRQTRLVILSRDLVYLSPSARIANARQDVDGLAARLRSAAQSLLVLRREQVRGISGALSKLNPVATLARGYAMAMDEAGRLLHAASQVGVGDRIRVRLHKGVLRAAVEAKEEDDE
jgi:exodeoxyribonuclease VII large subunit